MATLAEIAELVKGRVLGAAQTEITGVAGLDSISEGQITFVTSLKGLTQALDSKAAAVILPESLAEELTKPGLAVANPKLAFAQILTYFYPPPKCQPGISSQATIGANFVGQDIEVGSFVNIGDNVTIGSGSIIAAGAFIGNNVTLGTNTIIHPNVVIREGTLVGNNVQIHAGTVIGSDGFGYVAVQQQQLKIPQVGRVIIEDEVEIGANVAIDRATTGVTLIKKGTKIDNLVQIGHNCIIGEDSVICGMVGIAGSAEVGDRVTLAGKVGVNGHIKIGSNSVVAGFAMVIGSLPEYSIVSGQPARPHSEDMRIHAAATRLPDLVKEIRALQKKVVKLEEKLTTPEK